MNITISVIIPIYNVGVYLEECMNSVIDQTYEYKEIVLVDDGSTDNSPEICDYYVSKYNYIKVIHKQNGGLSDARNVGIKNSNGDYLLFLDADDFFNDKFAIQKLVDRINLTHADLLNFSYIKYYEDLNKYDNYFEDLEPLPLELSKTKSIKYLLNNNLYIASACNKLVKKSLFEDDCLYFVKGIYSEDIDWCLRLLIKANKPDFVCENFYCYRQRSNSITHTINDKKCQDLTNNILNCFSIVEKNDSLKDSLYRYVSYQFGTFFITQALAENYQSECINKLSKYKWVLKYQSNNKKLIVLNIMVTLFGYKLTCKIIRLFIKLRR